jgi:hypothetical protein
MKSLNSDPPAIFGTFHDSRKDNVHVAAFRRTKGKKDWCIFDPKYKQTIKIEPKDERFIGWCYKWTSASVYKLEEDTSHRDKTPVKKSKRKDAANQSVVRYQQIMDARYKEQSKKDGSVVGSPMYDQDRH